MLLLLLLLNNKAVWDLTLQGHLGKNKSIKMKNSQPVFKALGGFDVLFCTDSDSVCWMHTAFKFVLKWFCQSQRWLYNRQEWIYRDAVCLRRSLGFFCRDKHWPETSERPLKPTQSFRTASHVEFFPSVFHPLIQ